MNPEKYLVGKNGETPELPFWVLDGVPIGKIRSGKFLNDWLKSQCYES